MRITRVLVERRFVPVLAVLVAAAAGLALVAPNVIAGALALLIVAACPISMVVMMRTMGDHRSNRTMGSAGAGDMRSHLRDRIVAAQLEQSQLEQQLARLDTADQHAAEETRKRALATDVRPD